MQEKILIIALPLGIWAAFFGGTLGVLLTYFRSGEWRNYGRMVSEIVPAMIFSGSVAEKLLPLDNLLTCAAISLLIGVMTGFALDYWRIVGRYFVHNVFDLLSRKFTGAPLPPPDFKGVEKFRQPEAVEQAEQGAEVMNTPEMVAPKLTELPKKQANQTRRKTRKR